MLLAEEQSKDRCVYAEYFNCKIGKLTRCLAGSPGSMKNMKVTKIRINEGSTWHPHLRVPNNKLEITIIFIHRILQQLHTLPSSTFWKDKLSKTMSYEGNPIASVGRMMLYIKMRLNK